MRLRSHMETLPRSIGATGDGTIWSWQQLEEQRAGAAGQPRDLTAGDTLAALSCGYHSS